MKFKFQMLFLVLLSFTFLNQSIADTDKKQTLFDHVYDTTGLICNGMYISKLFEASLVWKRDLVYSELAYWTSLSLTDEPNGNEHRQAAIKHLSELAKKVDAELATLREECLKGNLPSGGFGMAG